MLHPEGQQGLFYFLDWGLRTENFKKCCSIFRQTDSDDPKRQRSAKFCHTCNLRCTCICTHNSTFLKMCWMWRSLDKVIGSYCTRWSCSYFAGRGPRFKAALISGFMCILNKITCVTWRRLVAKLKQLIFSQRAVKTKTELKEETYLQRLIANVASRPPKAWTGNSSDLIRQQCLKSSGAFLNAASKFPFSFWLH